MGRFLFGVVLGLLLSAHPLMGAIIPSPPPIEDKDTYLYLKRLYENLHNLPVLTTNPDGVRTGQRGDAVLLDNGAIEYLEVCTSDGPGGGTVWRGVALSDTP